MSNAPARQSTDVATRTPQQQIVDRIRSEDFRAELRMALPESVGLDRFTRATVTALMQNPDLADADPSSLFQAIIRCAQMGLAPDGRQAAITTFNTKGVKKAQTLPMIGGLRDIAAEYGWMMRTNVVYENDEFDYTEEPPMLRHRPVRPGQDRGQLIAAYAVAVHRDGRQMQTVLHPDEVAKRKAVAKTKAVWDQWTPQMWAKSAGHDLFDDLPLDPADQRIRLVLDASDMAPGESAQMLYGPHGAAVAREVGPAPALSLPQGSSSGADDGQQAEGADPQPSASSAPGPTDFGGEAADDGDPALPAEDITEDDVRLAKLAAEHVVHVTNKDTYVEGLTLAQVHENSDYDPVVFFRWALGDQLEDGDLKTAAIAYAKVNLPFLHDELVGGQQ